MKLIRKTGIEIILIVLIQIFLLINIVPAESYLIYQIDKPFKETIIKDKNNSELLLKLADILLNLITIKQIGLVSAQETSNYPAGSDSGITKQCCLENNEGAICMEYASTVIKNICPADKIVQSECDETSSCAIGCCFDSIQGTCSTKAPRGACESKGGEWSSDENCNIGECRKGCCILGNNVEFVTENRCEKLSSVYGFEKDFGNVANELECLAMAPQIGEGACVIGGGCTFGSAQECLSRKGEFYENKLCSNPSLNNSCERQKSIGCSDGKDEIYWFDSCGNRENIYSSDKDVSWNSGNILKKEESCNSNSGNAGSSVCGNCNYLLGSKCSASNSPKVLDGNFVCQDLSCVDEKGDKKENGESWCVYDSFIGDGKDAVGSRHWKRICIDGKVEVEPCADYRGEICVESDTEIDKGRLSSATCVINRAMECVDYNQNKDTLEENCKENSHCQLTKVNVDKGFKFDICTAQYPRGFDLIGEEDRATSSATQLCSMASQKCTVIYQKKLSGTWECVANCDCETKKFTEEMNNLCVALGDCGSYVNYIGDGTNNINVKKAPKISWQIYKKYAAPVEGQKAESDSIEYIVKRIGLGGSSEATSKDNGMKMVSLLGGASGALGVAALWYASTTGVGGGLGIAGLFGRGLSLVGIGEVGAFGVTSGTLAGFGAAAVGASIGAVIGGIVAKMFGLSGEAAAIVTAGSAIAALFTIALAPKDPLSYIITIAVAIILAAIMKIMGVGKIKKVIVKFECLPWQPPVGGNKCEECNKDPLKPCTEYRCSALGKACELVNKDSSNPQCISRAGGDSSAPRISLGNISEGYDFRDVNNNGVKIRTSEDKCIPAFTPVIFTLKTDERAQCKYDFEKNMKFDEMEEYPLESTYYTIEHTFGFNAPSIESIMNYSEGEITGNVKDKYSNLKMYVKCNDIYDNKNTNDYIINFCVSSGPDLTAPKIVATNPINNAYLKKDVKEIPLIIYTNEPANCKYDAVAGKGYGQMQNSMECNTDLNDPGLFGWECNTILTGLANSENKFYIKCLDKPWLAGTEGEANRTSMEEDYEFRLIGTREDLKISSTFPSGDIVDGIEPVSIEVEIGTSGGINSGKAICQYSFIDHEHMTDNLFKTGGGLHKQKFNLISGDYNIYIRCRDDAGNEALGNVIFSLSLDKTPPQVVRVFNSGDLKIITNEKAACYYNLQKCSFDLKDAISMTIGFDTKHSAEWKIGDTYHIKCEDEWGNKNSGCAIKVIPSMIE